ncbi:YagK/YfjJ domain-containing protein [Billgrantia antri]|uniref:Inovirus Gp2 family protein n=1 Tax=Billgrantia antri TaxID=2846777 RepID=A0ABS6ZMF9_9GAMM|nr:inovirus-type Gp2 protein [Halomonas antri]MBW6390200.1 inovirus Gp2 family protein [Halomonas antri]
MSYQKKRSTENTNHTLHYAPTFEPEPGVSLPVLTEKGPLVTSYLDTLYRVVKDAMNDHGRVLLVRCDLYCPREMPLSDNAHTNEFADKFIASVKSKVKADMRRKKSPHKPAVRFVMAREYSTCNRPHYHLALLLNGHAYRALGTFDYNGDNLFWKIAEAWASAWNIPVEMAMTRVYYRWGKRGVSVYRLNPEDNYVNFPAAFQRCSYLCKAATKRFGNGSRGLLSSKS